MRLLLEYSGNPYQENDQGFTPIDVCKHQEILHLLKEEQLSHDEEARGDSEEEDVFVPKEKRTRLRDAHLKTGSKGSSRSSADSFYEDDVPQDGGNRRRAGVYRDGTGSNSEVEAYGDMSKRVGHTPSRSRGVLYSDLSSSESEGEHLDPHGKSGVRKVRYHLAKMGEAKQKLLGKLEESSEVDGRVLRSPETGEKEGRGKGEEGHGNVGDTTTTEVLQKGMLVI